MWSFDVCRLSFVVLVCVACRVGHCCFVFVVRCLLVCVKCVVWCLSFVV